MTLLMNNAAGVPFGSFFREPVRRVVRYYVACGQEVAFFFWIGFLHRTNVQVVGTCGSASDVTHLVVSSAVFGSFCRVPRELSAVKCFDLSVVNLRM